MASFAVLSFLVAAALAQSNPFIPSGISAKCSAYLTSLDASSDFAACTQPLVTALQAFSPSSNTQPLSAAAITTFLQSFCPTTTCPQSTVATELTAFYAACQAELTSAQNPTVTTTYDSLYSLGPLKQAVCAKDDGGNYCAANLANPNISSATLAGNAQSQAALRQNLYTTLDGNSTALAPNAATFRNYNILFLFINPAASFSQLCTACTKAVLTAYISFESSCPYGPGLGNSQLLAGQAALYKNISTTCTASFLNGAVQAAGGLSGSVVSGAAPRIDGQEFPTVLGSILGLAAFVAASL